MRRLSLLLALGLGLLAPRTGRAGPIGVEFDLRASDRVLPNVFAPAPRGPAAELALDAPFQLRTLAEVSAPARALGSPDPLVDLGLAASLPGDPVPWLGCLAATCGSIADPASVATLATPALGPDRGPSFLAELPVALVPGIGARLAGAGSEIARRFAAAPEASRAALLGLALAGLAGARLRRRR